MRTLCYSLMTVRPQPEQGVGPNVIKPSPNRVTSVAIGKGFVLDTGGAPAVICCSKRDVSDLIMRYFITGSAGFIGFHLALRLLQRGHVVTGYDGFTPYYDVALKERRHEILAQFEAFRPIVGMLEDEAGLTRAAAQNPPDVIVHLAAQAGVRYSLENPGAYISSNLVGSWTVLELAKRIKPKHLLLASSSSIYGAGGKVPFAERDMTDEPLTLYAASKKAMELMAHSYAHLHHVPTTAFRFFTVYGPWGRPDMALFKFTEALLEGRPLDIYGQGLMSRDFTYIDDLTEAIIRLVDVPPAEANRVVEDGVVDTLSPHAPFRSVNIGGGNPVELIRFIETIETATGREAIRRFLPMQKGDVPRTFASPDLLRALTGFMPAISVEEGVPAFVSWYIDWRREQAARVRGDWQSNRSPIVG